MRLEAKKELISVHLPYEICMLKYTYGRITAIDSQLLWNSLFESFAIHARCIYDFLVSKKDPRNGIASDIVSGFKASKPDKISGKINAMNQQIMHFGTTRMHESDRKLKLEDAEKVFNWILENIKIFVSKLPEQYKACWNEKNAEPINTERQLVIPVANSATNYILVVPPIK